MFSTFYRIAKQDNSCWQKQQQYPGILYTQHTKVPWEKGHKHSRLIYQELLRNINSSYLGRVWAALTSLVGQPTVPYYFLLFFLSSHSFAPTSDKRLNLLCIYLFLLFAGECFGHKLEINVLCCVWVICPIYDRIMWRSEPWVAGINYMSLKLCTTSATTRGRICIKLSEHTNFYGAHPLHFGI